MLSYLFNHLPNHYKFFDQRLEIINLKIIPELKSADHFIFLASVYCIINLSAYQLIYKASNLVNMLFLLYLYIKTISHINN